MRTYQMFKDLRQIYRNSADEKERKMFGLLILVYVAYLVLVIATCLYDPNSAAARYQAAQNRLFVAIAMVLLGAVAIGHRFSGLLYRIKEATGRDGEWSLPLITDVLLALLVIFSIASLLFVLDLGFIAHYGVKLGTIAALAMVRIVFVRLRR